MEYYFCLIPAKDAKIGSNVGRTYAYAHRSEWIKCTEMSTYLGAGYVKGVDHVVHNGKTYMMMKNYLDIDQKFGVFVCTEVTTGCETD